MSEFAQKFSQEVASHVSLRFDIVLGFFMYACMSVCVCVFVYVVIDYSCFNICT